MLAAAPEQVALTSSTTQGIGLVTAGLDWAAGDEVITTTEEHPGLTSPLDVLARRFGIEVRAVEAERVLDAISPATRMVAVSHVLWTTGRVLDMAAISARAHEVGAWLLVDGAQGAGNIEVDPAALGVDFYAFSGQKWLLGPEGSGGAVGGAGAARPGVAGHARATSPGRGRGGRVQADRGPPRRAAPSTRSR